MGLTTGAHDAYNRALGIVKQADPESYANPDGWARSIGHFIGEALPIAPVSEIRVGQALGPSSKLAQALAKYGDYAAQGAAGGLLTSGGDNITGNMAAGAALAPALGAVAEHVIAPPLIKAWGKAKGIVSPMAQDVIDGIASRVGAGEEGAPIVRGLREDAPPAFVKPDGSVDWEAAKAADAASAARGDVVPSSPDGLTGVVHDDSSRAALTEGLKATGARNGIEATPALPGPTQQKFDELISAGVPKDQALNEAAILHIGGKPTVGTVTRDMAAQEAEREGAKLTTEEGAALRQRQAENNQALHTSVQQTVQDYGGIPAQDETAETVAQSLAKTSDAAKAKVSQAYADARATDGDQRVAIDGLRELLARPDYRAPTTNEGRALVTGLRRQIAAMAQENGGRFSPDEIDQLTKSANAAYNPMGGGANHMVGDIKAALTESLDQFDNAGDAYRNARALHRQWAEQYDDPAGIANLIKRDAQGNFVNADNWRRAGNGLIGSTNDKGFIQVVRQLQRTGDKAALDKLKADIVQRAYQKATNTASADQLGNPNFSAKAWETALNSIGLPKLNALFSPEEIAHLATIGRAARALNEAVPGSANTSHTASKLANALKAANDAEKGHSSGAKAAIGKALKGGAHFAVGHVAPGIGNAALEGVTGGMSKAGNAAAKAKAAKAVGKAIRESLDPDLARAAANDDAAAQAAKSSRDALAKTLAKRAAPTASSRSKD